MTENAITSVMRGNRTASGFTLLELMVTLFVLSILLTFGVPTFFETIRSNRAAANANELVSALSIARSEAVRRGTRITLCPTADGNGCNGAWTQRWLLFVDTAATDTAAPTFAAANVIREWAAPGGNAVIATQAAGVSAAVEWIRFLPRGQAVSDEGMPVVFGMEIEGCSGLEGRDIEVNTIGRTSVERVEC